MSQCHWNSEHEQAKDSSAEHLEISKGSTLIRLQQFNFQTVRRYRREPSSGTLSDQARNVLIFCNLLYTVPSVWLVGK